MHILGAPLSLMARVEKQTHLPFSYLSGKKGYHIRKSITFKVLLLCTELADMDEVGTHAFSSLL